MKKKLLMCLLLSLVLLAFLAPASASASTVVARGQTAGTAVERDTLNWTLDSDGTLTISGQGDMGSYKTSNGLRGDAPWIVYADSVTSIVIEEGVTGLGERAFSMMKNVTSVFLPRSLECSRAYAFYVPKVDWKPKTVYYAGELEDWLHLRFISDDDWRTGSAAAVLYTTGTLYFNGAPMPEEISIPGSIGEVPTAAFYGVLNLTTVHLEYGIERIGDDAFSNCMNLCSVELPDSLSGPVGSQFWQCPSLRSLKIPIRVTEVHIWDCASLAELELTDSVTSLYVSECPALEQITLPSRLKSLTMIKCGLTELVIPNSVTDFAVGGNSRLRSVQLPGTITSVDGLSSNSALESIEIPYGVTSIGSYAFSNCTSLKSVSFPETLTQIDIHAFEGCSSLSSVELPDSLTILKQYAFKDCVGLRTATFGSQLISLEGEAFAGCTELNSLRFRGAAPYVIAENAFEGVNATASYPAASTTWTSGLRKDYGGSLSWQADSGMSESDTRKVGRCGSNLTWSFSPGSGTLTISGRGAMDDYMNGWAEDNNDDVHSTAPWRDAGDRIRHIEIENGVTYIGSYAFGGLTALESVSFPVSLAQLGDCVFQYSGLRTITLPSGISEVPYGCFYCCEDLESIEIPGNIRKIGNLAFAWCKKLSSIRFPDSVTEIGAIAFEGCTSLNHVVLPAYLTTLRDGVFEGCEALTDIQLGKNLEVLEKRCLWNCNQLNLVIPGSVRQIDSIAFGGAWGEQFRDMDTPIGELYFEGDMPAGAKDALDNTTVGTLYYPTGKNLNNYRLSQSGVNYRSWVPGGASITACTFSLSSRSFVYDGLAKRPTVCVSFQGDQLSEGTHYTLLYKNNTNAGTASVTVTGTGSFYDSKTLTFEIAPAVASLSFAKSNYEVELGSGSFTNKLTSKTDGTIRYSSSNPNIASVNETTGQITPKKTGATTIWAKATGGRNYKDMSTAFNLTVKSSKTYSFSVNDLSYAFSNSASAFGYPNGYKIPLSRYEAFFSSSRARSLYNGDGEWGGSCYGMAATSGMFNVEGSGLSLSAFGTTRIGSLSPNTVSRNTSMTVGSNVRNMIEYAFVSQYAYQIQACYSYNTNLNDVCSAVSQITRSGTPVMIAIFGKGGGHALLAYSIQKISSTLSRMYVYDCNYPNAQRYISLTTDSSGRYTSWTYSLSSMTTWGSNYAGGRISYVPYSQYASAWNDRESNRKTNLLMTAAQNFEICDYAGNWIATMRDGELISSDPDIFAYKPVDLEAENDEYILYLPTSTYQIVNTAPEEELTLRMLNWDLGSTVRTDTDVIVLTVEDNDDCNMVYLSTEAGDEYDVTLSSDLEGSGYDEMTFTGTGDGSVIQIGMHNGEMILANCPDIIINGASRQRSLADCQVRLEYLQVKGDGTEKRPGVTIIDGQRPLEQDVDYTLGYVSNVNVGFATVAIYGKGLYTGELFLSFEILSTEPCLDGHVWGEPELVIAPTLAKDGTVRRYCEHCGRCREESLAAYSFEQTAFADGVLSISLQNNMVTALNGICFLTAYDGQGSMLASEQLKVYIEPNESSAFSLALPPDSVCQRAFILDRDTFSPLGPVWDNAD